MNNTPLIDRPLSGMQQAFAEEYCKCFVKSRAALRAGYAKKNAHKEGCRLYGDPRIKAYIDEFLDASLKETRGIVLKNIEFWTDTIDDDDADLKDKLRASELLGKSAAMFTEKHENLIKTLDDNGEETGFNFVDPPKKDE